LEELVLKSALSNNSIKPAQQATSFGNWFYRNRHGLSLVLTIITDVALLFALYVAFTAGDQVADAIKWTLAAVVILVVIGTASAVIVSAVTSAGGLWLWPSRRVSGKVVTSRQNIEADGATSLRASFELQAGTLRLAGGKAQVLEATFTYDDTDWRAPKVEYGVDGSGQGMLAVSQGATHRPSYSQGPNDWTIRVNDEIPTDLTVGIGAGAAYLDLRGLQLSGLSIDSGVGALTVDFGNELKHSLAARVKGGIGSATLRLPENVGVKVQTKVGMGSVRAGNLTWDDRFRAYVNAAYGRSPVTLDISFEGGMGDLKLEPSI
jgi:hypothetical protein